MQELEKESNFKIMKYFEELKKSMNYLAENKKTVFIGQAVEVPGTAMSNTLKDINPFLANYLNDEQTRSKAYQYYDNFKDGKYERMYAAIKNMDKMDLRTDESVNIDQELATLDKQKQLFDYLNGKDYQNAQGENNTLDDVETSDLFYTIIKMQGLKNESKESLNEVISNLTEAYGAVDYEQKFKKNPTGFKEALQQKHDILALKKLIEKYENLGFEEAATCN